MERKEGHFGAQEYSGKRIKMPKQNEYKRYQGQEKAYPSSKWPALAPSSPIELPHKFKVATVELVLSASANALAPSSPIEFSNKYKLVTVELVLSASASA
ncbi:hypothetical protein BGZ68_001213 [Mortierella alpina]|nr:hypothetical protein BGZ68_001213 [Mortierella alpina]